MEKLAAAIIAIAAGGAAIYVQLNYPAQKAMVWLLLVVTVYALFEAL